MGLERFDPEDHNPLQWDGQMVCRADGEYYRTADVDALLARIRAAVAAWMMAPRGEESCDDPDCGCWDSYNEARDALNALLAGSECSSLCAPGSGERCMVTDDGRCPEGGE